MCGGCGMGKTEVPMPKGKFQIFRGGVLIGEFENLVALEGRDFLMNVNFDPDAPAPVTYPGECNIQIEMTYVAPDFFRSCGLNICNLCGKDYYHHPADIEVLGYDGRPFLKRLCNGQLVKL